MSPQKFSTVKLFSEHKRMSNREMLSRSVQNGLTDRRGAYQTFDLLVSILRFDEECSRLGTQLRIEVGARCLFLQRSLKIADQTPQEVLDPNELRRAELLCGEMMKKRS